MVGLDYVAIGLMVLATAFAIRSVVLAVRFWLSWARSDIIGGDGTTYMERWKLLRTPWFQIRVHHILRSDRDDALHDHPASFISLILWGGYLDVTPNFLLKERYADFFNGLAVYEYTLRRAGRLVWHQAEDMHRIELVVPHASGCSALYGPTHSGCCAICGARPRPAWTLVLWLHPRGARPWGYLPKGRGWVASHVFHAETGATLREPHPRPDAAYAPKE